MNRFERAREYILSLPEPIGDIREDITNEDIANSLDIIIAVKETKKEEEEISLGHSKITGLPHLPNSFEWPQKHLFFAQINLSDIAHIKTPDNLPSEGMLYFFYNEDPGNETGCVRYSKEVDKLIITDYPESFSFKNREKQRFKDYPIEIEFTEQFTFNHWGVDNSLLPAVVKDELSEILNCEPLIDFPQSTLLGKPHYWQEEDEKLVGSQEDFISYKKMMDEILAIGDIDSEGYWDDLQRALVDLTENDASELLKKEVIPQSLFDSAIEKIRANVFTADMFIFQGDVGGTIHFWINRESFVTGDFSDSRLTYSGT